MNGKYTTGLMLTLTLSASACSKEPDEHGTTSPSAVTKNAQDIAVARIQSTAKALAKEPTPPDESERWIALGRTDVLRVVDDVGGFLADATDDFEEKNNQGSAESVRLAERALLTEADGLDAPAHSRLKRPANEQRDARERSKVQADLNSTATPRSGR
jgi:hypothetical protein